MADDETPNRAVGLIRQSALRLPVAADAVQGLTETLQGAARALASRDAAGNREGMRVQSRVIMAIAEELGATRLFLLAENLHDRASDPACPALATALAEMQNLLHPLILSLQAARNAGLIRS